MCAESTFIKLLRINHFASTHHLAITLARVTGLSEEKIKSL